MATEATNVIALDSVPSRPSGIQPMPINTDLTKEFVANGYSLGQQHILGSTQDEVEIEINLETYEKMENDSAISKSKHILVTNTLSDELQFAPGATEEEVGPEEYQIYVEVMELAQRALAGLDRPYRETLEQQLGNAIRYGHGIGEVVYEYRTDASSTKPPEDKADPKPARTKVGAFFSKLGGLFMGAAEPPPDPGIKRPILRNERVRLMPKAIKVKPRGSVRFVVDDFMTVLGLVPATRNSSSPLRIDEIIDRDKFSVLTMHKQDEDPRGKSTYRPAFNWYNLKTQVPSELLRFILEESVPKAVATLPPNAAPFEFERDKDGQFVKDDTGQNVMLPIVESFKRMIERFRSGSGVVVPYEAKFEPYKKGVTGTNDADLFTKICKLLDDQMENCILLQTLAQSEGEHQARSASQQVAEILYNLIFWIRWLIAVMTVTDIVDVVITKNLGEWALRYKPFVSLGDSVRRDWRKDLEMVAKAYFWGFIDDTQRAELMAWLNLPKPGPSRQELGLEATAQADVNGDPVVPNGQRPDKQPGTRDRNKGNGTEKKNVKQNENTGFSPLNFLGHHGRRTTGTKGNLFSSIRSRARK